MRASVLALLLLGAAAARPVAAQQIEVRIVQPDGVTPGAGVIVEVRREAGPSVARGLTDARGRFEATLRGAGRYLVRALRIGFLPTESPVRSVAAGESLSVTLILGANAVTLATISVDANAACATSARGDTTVVRLWDEARKALTAAQLTETHAGMRVVALQYEALGSADGRELPRTRSGTWKEGTSPRPFMAVPLGLLAVQGYVGEDLEGGTFYRAPDADILLSDAFATAHCLRAVAGPAAHPEWIGLAFEPVRNARLADIAGTLWIDRVSAELREVEFRFTGLSHEDDQVRHGGRVGFRRLPTGLWIVDAWELRMPRPMERSLTLKGGRIGEVSLAGERLYTTGEAFEDLLPTPRSMLAMACGEASLGATWGMMKGRVVRADGEPAVGAEVRAWWRVGMNNTERDAMADRAGEWFICRLPVGISLQTSAKWQDERALKSLRIPRAERLFEVEYVVRP